MKSKNKYLHFKSFIGGWIPFSVTILFFGVVSVAMAVTADFPLPFDERYHFILIQYYSERLSPFITSQPAELAFVGDATRYGSYLSHYLLSFPLRLAAVFTDSISTQILILRLINIGFVIGALVLLRRFVLRLTKSSITANGAVALLAVLPVTSLLAAHINYDNLFLLTFAGLLVVAQDIIKRAKANKDSSATALMCFVAIALLGCLVKFTFLPLAAVILLFIATVLIRHGAWPKVVNSSGKLSYVSLIAAFLLCFVASGMFIERYGGNVVAYKSLQPDCSAVQQLSVCMQYGPWARNYTLLQAAQADAAFEGRSIQGYAANLWLPIMIRGLGGVNSQGIVAEIPQYALTSAKVAVALLTVGLLGAAVMYRRDSLVLMTVAAMGLYVGALFHRNYSEFMSFHEIVAVQGRYAVPLVIPFVVIGLLGIRMYVTQSRVAARKTIGLMVLLRTIHPEEAYERTASYWSAKVWRRRLSDS